jgi:hypothetical protein
VPLAGQPVPEPLGLGIGNPAGLSPVTGNPPYSIWAYCGLRRHRVGNSPEGAGLADGSVGMNSADIQQPTIV